MTQTSKTLQEWLPNGEADACPRLAKKLTMRVVADHRNSTERHVNWYTSRWPGPHKNVGTWCLLEDGTLVGWNESPTVGWSYPSMRLVRQDLYTVRVGDQVIADNQNYASAEVFERQPGAEKAKNGRYAYVAFGKGLPSAGRTIAVTEAPLID